MELPKNVDSLIPKADMRRLHAAIFHDDLVYLAIHSLFRSHRACNRSCVSCVRVVAFRAHIPRCRVSRNALRQLKDYIENSRTNLIIKHMVTVTVKLK